MTSPIIEIEESFLSSICKQIRLILSENQYIQDKLTDTKRPTESIIGDTPLNWKYPNRDYMISVYHTCFEQFEDKGRQSLINGIVYIDFSRKVVQKENKIVTDELDRFVHTTLDILYNASKSLNDTVDWWTPKNKRLWESQPIGSDKIQNEKLIDYICQLTIHCQYVSNYWNYA